MNILTIWMVSMTLLLHPQSLSLMAAMFEEIVVPSLLPPAIISAGWIKSHLDGHSKALRDRLTLTPDLIYPNILMSFYCLIMLPLC